jgi:flavorubredoxin
MKQIKESIYWLGTIDWDRRLFDSLIPLPDGTTYNSYLIKGSEKTALLDAVDPDFSDSFLDSLSKVSKIDYIVSHHAEQDHSGSIPHVLSKFPDAKVVVTEKGKGFLIDLLDIKEDCFIVAKDGDTLSLGDKTLKFIHTPWVHWPETMVSYLLEDKILFSCDFFGSHIAASGIYVEDKGRVHEAAKRYFAEIMMPFRSIIAKNLDKLSDYEIEMIAPSHGQIYKEPEWIINEYTNWVSGNAKNLVVIPYISMHGSTKIMVDYFTKALSEKGVEFELFNLSVTDIGKLAMSLVDAGTIVLGTPTVLGGPHPVVAHAAFLANALRPKPGYLSIIGSYGWGGKTVETLANMVSNIKAEILEPVLCKGLPKEDTLKSLDNLAEQIAKKHEKSGFK